MVPIDPTDLIGKATVHQAYLDAVQPAAKQIGGLAEDTAKALRLFTLPIQLLAAGQDRFRKFCEEVRARVPEERQVEAPPEVAGPAMLNLLFLEDSNPLRTLYANLLSRAIDRDHQAEAHPGFVKIIEQMSQREALLLCAIVDQLPMQIDLKIWLGSPAFYVLWHVLKMDAHIDVAAVDHLLSLGIIDTVEVKDSSWNAGLSCEVRMTMFGERFVAACLPPRDERLAIAAYQMRSVVAEPIEEIAKGNS